MSARVPTRFSIPSLRFSAQRPVETRAIDFPIWSHFSNDADIEATLAQLEPALIGLFLCGYEAQSVIFMIDSLGPSNPQHRTEVGVHLRFWTAERPGFLGWRNDGNRTPASTIVSQTEGGLAASGAGYAAISYRPRLGFEVGTSQPNLIDLDGAFSTPDEAIQVRDREGNLASAMSSHPLRWLTFGLGDAPVGNLTLSLGERIVVIADSIGAAARSAAPGNGMTFIFDPATWNDQTSTFAPGSAQALAEQVFDSWVPFGDGLGDEITGAKNAYDRLLDAAAGDEKEAFRLSTAVLDHLAPYFPFGVPIGTEYPEVPGERCLDKTSWTIVLLRFHLARQADILASVPRVDLPSPLYDWIDTFREPFRMGVGLTVSTLDWSLDTGSDWITWAVDCSGAAIDLEATYDIMAQITRLFTETNPLIVVSSPCTIYRFGRFVSCVLMFFQSDTASRVMDFWIDGMASDPANLTQEVLQFPPDARGIPTTVSFYPLDVSEFITPHFARIEQQVYADGITVLWGAVVARLRATQSTDFPTSSGTILADAVRVGQAPSPFSGATETANDFIYFSRTRVRYMTTAEGANAGTLSAPDPDTGVQTGEIQCVDAALYFFGGMTLTSEVEVSVEPHTMTIDGISRSGWLATIESWRVRLSDRIDFNPGQVQEITTPNGRFEIRDDMFYSLKDQPCPGHPAPVDYYAMADTWVTLPLTGYKASAFIPTTPITVGTNSNVDVVDLETQERMEQYFDRPGRIDSALAILESAFDRAPEWSDMVPNPFW